MNGFNRKLALALDAHLCGRGNGFGVTRLADLMGKPVATIRNWCTGTCSPSAVDLLLVVDAIQAEEPRRATLLWADVSRIVKHVAQPLDPLLDHDPLPVDVLKSGAAHGQLAAEIACHGPETDPYEARRALPLARAAVAQDVEVVAKLEVIVAKTPQRALAGVGA